MIAARNRIKQLLQSLGCSEEKIARISEQIEDMILHDLKNNVASETDRITHRALLVVDSSIENKFKGEFENY
jgi:hypothetical protein